MRQYKDSGIEWIGKIPETWIMTEVKRLCQKITDGSHFSPQTQNEGKVYITVSNVYNDKVHVEEAAKISNQDFENLVANGCQPPVGAVLLSKDGTVGRTAIVDNNDYVVLSSLGILCPSSHVLSKYLKYLLDSESLQAQMRLAMAGSALHRITITKINNLVGLLPSLPEQQRITNYLDEKCGEIDSLIVLQEQMIEKLKAYKLSVITEAVTKGLDPNAKLAPSGIDWIGEIPEAWSKDKVIRCFSKIGSGTTPKSTDDNLFQGDINWLQSGDINGGDLYEASKHISKETLSSYSALNVYQAPFIIIAMYGASVGNISISHIDACVNQACCVLSGCKLDFNYAFYALKSAKPYLIYRAEGGGQPNISQDKIKTLWIPTPPLSEQHAIVSYLDEKCFEIDCLIALKQRKVESLKDYKKSIIYEAVTGKTIIE